jgi:hypothetical protein
MSKTEILATVLKLAGFSNIKIEMERGDGVSYSGDAHRIHPDGEIEPISFHGTNFPTALASLLAVLYDTDNVDFETNAAIIFGD